VRGLAAPCPRCEKLTIAKRALVDEDLTVYILFRCEACGKRWEKVNSVEVTVEEWDKGGRPPSP